MCHRMAKLVEMEKIKMEIRKVQFVATGSMTRDVEWLNSSHGITMTALEEVTSFKGIGDMLRYDDGVIVKGLFTGAWVKSHDIRITPYRLTGETVNMEGSVEPQATAIDFHIVIEANQWTPARWDTFGVKTDLLVGSIPDEITHQERLDLAQKKHDAAREAAEFWTDALADEAPELVVDDIEIYTLNSKYALTLDSQPIAGADGTHRFDTLQDAVDAALVLIMQRTVGTRVHKWIKNIVWHSEKWR